MMKHGNREREIETARKMAFRNMHPWIDFTNHIILGPRSGKQSAAQRVHGRRHLAAKMPRDSLGISGCGEGKGSGSGSRLGAVGFGLGSQLGVHGSRFS